jgi:hypothetical protein
VSTNFPRNRRAPTKGLIQSPAVVRTVPAPFTRGVVTDRQSWELDPQETPAAEDMIFPRGVAVARGPLATTPTVSIGGVAMFASIAADLPSYGGSQPQPSPVFMTATTSGTMGVANTGFGTSIGVPGASTTKYFPREVYKGEILWCDQGLFNQPIVRTSGAPDGTTATPAAATGTVAVIAGANVVLGVGTNFIAAAPVGSYIVVAGVSNRALRVSSVASNTMLTVDAPFPVAGAGLVWGLALRHGVIGLAVPVTSAGVITMASGSPNVQGYGMNWGTGAGPYSGLVLVNDSIAIQGNYTRLDVVSSITSGSTLTMTQNAYATFTQKPYWIYRNACARECRYHNGRMYFCGFEFDETGVYYSPVNFNLGDHQNGEIPTAAYTTNYGLSQLMLKFDVPIAGADGKNVALLSLGSSLVILRTDDAYLMSGDPPTETLQRIGSGAGCIEIRAACHDPKGRGVYWAGREGIYHYSPGDGLRDLTQGRRNREWKTISSNVSLYNGWQGSFQTGVVLAVKDDHLFVFFHSDIHTYQNGRTWVYDLNAEAWCGDFTTFGTSKPVIYAAPYDGVKGQEVYLTLRSETTPQALGDIVRDVEDQVAGGNFVAELPESVTGTPDNLSRVTEMKVTYELDGTASTKLRVESSVDGEALGVDADLPETTNGPQTAVPLYPKTVVGGAAGGALGKLGRRHRHRFSGQGGNIQNLRVHHIDLVVRSRRHRA